MRKLCIALFLVAGLGLLALGVWLSTYRDRINPDGFKRISEGMTEREVELALRSRPGHYGTGRGRVRDGGAWQENRYWTDSKVWTSDDGQIIVYFIEGRVVGYDFRQVYVRDDHRTFSTRIRDWLGL